LQPGVFVTVPNLARCDFEARILGQNALTALYTVLDRGDRRTISDSNSPLSLESIRDILTSQFAGLDVV
jgi:hypothetical protein